MKGDFMAVDPTGRLSITWAKLKRQLH